MKNPETVPFSFPDPQYRLRGAGALIIKESSVQIRMDGKLLNGDLHMPRAPKGIIIFAHGSGSSRLSPRNRRVAGMLQNFGLSTLLLDLLTIDEERAEAATGQYRFDIGLLASRLAAATAWVRNHAETESLSIGYFGASTGAAAAIAAATRFPSVVRAIVSRGGRPDLAGGALDVVMAPTLLIVGGRDTAVLGLNEKALARLRCVKGLEVVPNATHLFEERGALESVSELAIEWFDRYVVPRERRRFAAGW